MSFHVPERMRVRTGPLRTDAEDGNNGLFFVPLLGGVPLRVIATDHCGWEHVSVSLPNRCPTWKEMCKVKDLFWDAEDCVMQLHPPQADYVSNHPYCLHLWRPVDGAGDGQIPRPPTWMVGIKELGEVA